MAALSVLDSVVRYLSHESATVVGLGLSQASDRFCRTLLVSGDLGAEMTAEILDGALQLGAAAVFAILGMIALWRHPWAFVAGLLAYVADGIVLALFHSWPAVAFHAFIALGIAGGWRAARRAGDPEG